MNFGNDERKTRARQALIEKRGLDRLFMNFSGTGGKEKNFV
jgi:hypothetical protein